MLEATSPVSLTSLKRFEVCPSVSPVRKCNIPTPNIEIGFTTLLNRVKSGAAQLACRDTRFSFWHVWNLINCYLRVSYEKRISSRNGHGCSFLRSLGAYRGRSRGGHPCFGLIHLDSASFAVGYEQHSTSDHPRLKKSSFAQPFKIMAVQMS